MYSIQYQAHERRLLPARKESTPVDLLFEDIRDCGGISSLRQTGGPRPRPQGKPSLIDPITLALLTKFSFIPPLIQPKGWQGSQKKKNCKCLNLYR